MKTAISSLALALMLASSATADQAIKDQSVTAREARMAFPAIAAPGSVRPVHAVLRYDLSTAGACRAWSDQPPELCILFALHVIDLSEHPPKAL